MPIRLQFSSAASGASPYTVVYNPYFFDPKDEADIAPLEVLHGATIWQEVAADERHRFFRWENVPVATPYSTMRSYFKSIEGQIRYINFNNLQSMAYRWPGLTTWNKARIVTIKTAPLAQGKLIYEYIELVVKPE